MENFGGHQADCANVVDLVRQLVDLGEPDEAIEVLREYVAGGGYDNRLPEIAVELRDRDTLYRLAAKDDRAAVHWAATIIEEEGVEAADAALAVLPWATVPGATHRVSLGRALLDTGRFEAALRVATEVLEAQPSGHFVFGARCLVTDVHVAREDLEVLQQLGEAGDKRAEEALFRILGDREDLSALTWHAGRGRRAARQELVKVYERRGDLEGLLALFRRGYSEAEDLAARWCWERGAHEQVSKIAERGGAMARKLLVEAAASQGDRESLTRYAARRYKDAGYRLNLLLAAQGDVAALRERASGDDYGFEVGDSHAVAMLAEVFIERGDVDGLGGLVAAFPDDWQLPWRLAELLAAQGRTTELRSHLHRIIDSERERPDHPREARRLADAGDIDGLRECLWSRVGLGKGANVGPEMLEWVALAVTSGVLGNAAYAGLSAAISKLWGRIQNRRDAAAASGTEAVEAVGPEPAWHTAREALEVACLAVHEHCTQVEVAVPDFAQVSYEVQHSRGRWVFVFREPAARGGRRFQVSVPPRQEGSDRCVVTMQVPSRSAERSLGYYL
jgi:tetratricopeptide (TPR) repeat protein